MSITVLGSKKFNQALSFKPHIHSLFLSGPNVNVSLAYGYCQYHEKQRATDTYPAEIPTAVAAEPNGRRGREDYVDQPTYVQCA